MNSPDFRTQLTERLKELHLPALRRCFEEKAQERREHRVARLLQESKLPLEKTLGNFDLQRLPPKAARHIGTLRDGTFLDAKRTCWFLETPAAGKRICCRPSGRN
jgi:DNA replication protein DnaC